MPQAVIEATKQRETDRLAALASAAAAVSVCAYVAAPQAAPAIVVGALIGARLLASARDTGDLLRFDRTLAALLPLLFAFLIAAARTPEPTRGVLAVCNLVLYAGGAWAIVRLQPTLSATVTAACARGFLIGMAIASAFLCIEILSSMAIRRFLASILPLTRPNTGYATWENGWMVALPPFMSNKSVAALTFLFWPVLLLSSRMEKRHWLFALRSGAIVAAIAAVAWSEHEASKLALVASAIVYLVTRLSRKFAIGLLAFGWIGATMLVVPVALFAYESGVYRNEAIQHSGRHRIVIWGYTAQQIMKSPWLGHGIAATRAADEADKDSLPLAPGSEIKLGTNIHSHNVFLQLWHEAGALGAIAMFLAGLPALAWLRGASAPMAPHLYAGWTAAVILASLTWSLLAPWFMASFAFAMIWTRFAAFALELGFVPARSKS